VFGLAGFLIFGMRDYYVALTDRRLIFINASFLTSRPEGFAWSDARDSVTIGDLQTNTSCGTGARSQAEQAEPPHELPRVLASRAQAMGDLLADRMVGPRLPLWSRRRSGSVRRPWADRAADTASVTSRAPRLYRRRRADRSARDPLLPWRGSGGV
jgi:hypothetical protein